MPSPCYKIQFIILLLLLNQLLFYFTDSDGRQSTLILLLSSFPRFYDLRVNYFLAGIVDVVICLLPNQITDIAQPAAAAIILPVIRRGFFAVDERADVFAHGGIAIPLPSQFLLFYFLLPFLVFLMRLNLIEVLLIFVPELFGHPSYGGLATHLRRIKIGLSDPEGQAHL